MPNKKDQKCKPNESETSKCDPSKSQRLTVVLSSLGMLVISVSLILGNIRNITNPPRNETSNNGEVQGASLNAEDETKQVEIRIVDDGNGKAYLYLIAYQKTRIAGVEVDLNVSDELKVLNLACQGSFVCVQDDVENNTIRLSALQLPENANTAAEGNINVALIEYDPLTTGTISVKTDPEPQVIDLDTSTNLVGAENLSFDIGTSIEEEDTGSCGQ